MKLRWYQEKAIVDARDELRRLSKEIKHRKPRLLIQLPPGAGKTMTAAAMAKSTIDKGGTCVFLCHRDFLLEQTSETFTKLGIKHSFLAAGKWLNPWEKCHIGMVASMKSRINKIKAPSLCFIDECHHVVSKTWNEIVDAWPDTTFILLSGTPSFRSDGKGLDIVADSMIHGPSIKQLIAEGALSDYRYYAPTMLDTSKFKVRMGEYVQHEVDAEMSGAIIGDIVESYKKYADGTLAAYFAPSVDTSRKYAAAFNESGIVAKHMDANTPKEERRRIIKSVANGEIHVIVNVGLLGEGFDLGAIAETDVTIETVGLCRPTKSFPLLMQMAMRAMRAKQYPGIILDHANCYNDHNWLPDDDIEWTLDSTEKPKFESSVIMCRGCGAALKRGVKLCPSCSTAVTREDVEAAEARRGPMHIDGELVEIARERARMEREEAIKANKKEQGGARSLEDLIELGKNRGYKNPRAWARHIYSARGGGK